VRQTWNSLKRYPALLLLIAVYIISCGVVASNWWRGTGHGAAGQRKKVLRMAHWQLEPGIRQGIDELIKDYEELHPDVEVRQILIPEEGYFQWVNTQLTGDTAPEMIECGLGGSSVLWQKFYARYFLPLDEHVGKPNPYNAGTPLEQTPWRDTYFDGMEGGYEETLQSYFRVPLSAFTVRLYYNEDMLRKHRGDEGFPETYEDWIEVCKRLRDAGITPIAGSEYSVVRFFRSYQAAMTANYLDTIDANYDGNMGLLESAAAMYSGRVDMMEPAIRANFEVIRELADYFPRGFMGMDRDEATFLFLQGHTAMIITGSWDFQKLSTQAQFDVGIAPIPMPSKSHPRYGPYVAGPATEANSKSGFPFGIPKVAKHKQEALDFLQFLSSARSNKRLNDLMEWLPVIKAGPESPPEPLAELKPFAPRIEGYATAIEYKAPGVEQKFDQKLPLYLEGQVPTYEAFVEQFMSEFRRLLPEGVTQTARNGRSTMDQQLCLVAVRRAALSGLPGAAAPLRMARVREGEAGRDIVLPRYVRMIEAYTKQLIGRNDEVGAWLKHAGPKFAQKPAP